MSSAPPEQPAGATRRNLELKVRVTPGALAAIRRDVKDWLGSEPRVERQRDRYFRVPEGRLKLRTITYDTGASRAELIAYQRPDVHGSRWSDYRIAPVVTDEAEQLAATLAQVLPLLVDVRKRREIAIAGVTRIHLDEVEELGAFVELETVVTDTADSAAEREHASVIERLGLAAWPVEAGSYSDLLHRREQPRAIDSQEIRD
jgi:predicted adenylyl cyclase CyaB